MPSLGVLYLAAVLEQHKIDVEVVPSHVSNLSWEELARKFEQEKPDVIGITTTTENRFQSFRLAKVAKQARPQAFVALGGPHFTGTAHDTLSHILDIDGVVSREGELTFLELVRALESGDSLRKVDGLAFREDGRIIENSPRQRIPDGMMQSRIILYTITVSVGSEPKAEVSLTQSFRSVLRMKKEPAAHSQRSLFLHRGA